MSAVFSVQDVHFHINKSNPPQLVVQAIGMASTSGWSNPKLVPRAYVNPPTDGMQEFDFHAEPPMGIALQVMTPVAGVSEIELKNWIVGIRVFAQSNNISILLDEGGRIVNAV